MTRKTQHPAIQQAVDYVRIGIDKGAWKSGERLPVIRRLAREAGVAHGSMEKAIPTLKEMNLVHGLPHHRLIVGAQDANPEVIIEEESMQWQRKRKILESDLVSGVFGLQGDLPSLKELQFRYGVCFRTMKKILNAMATDNVVHARGKGYSLTETPLGPRRKKIVFISNQSHYKLTSALNDEHNRMINLFENECLRIGFHLEIIEIDFYDSVAARRAIPRLGDNDMILGFILDVWWHSSEIYQRSYFDVLTRLSRFNKPIAFLDETCDFDLPEDFTTNPLIQVFRIEGKQAGARMYRFLAGLGHRSVAYISMYHHTGWSRERFIGIKEQCARMGRPDGSHLVAESVTFGLPEVISHSRLSKEKIWKLIIASHSAAEAADLKTVWAQYKPDRRTPFKDSLQLSEPLRRDLSDLADLLQKDSDPFFSKQAASCALGTVDTRIFQLRLQPLFEKAIRLTEVSAWICANDKIAFEALAFLSKLGKKVPQDISVAGFDNTPVVALEQGLTTFDFSTTGFIHRMLHFILHPRRVRGPYKHSVDEVEGIILERNTTARHTA